MDFQASPSTSARMRKVKSKKTKLEMHFASLLREAGIKYRSHPDIYGHPDFRIFGTKIVIFCDSSFWHGRRARETSGEVFKRNKEFWVSKLLYNKARDRKISSKLRQKEWIVLRFWDDDIYKRSDRIISRIKHYATKE